MQEGLFIVAITTPGELPEETQAISSILLDNRADMVHIRKPEWNAEKIAALIESVPRHLWHKLKIHDHFELLKQYPLGGVHLNSRNPIAPENACSVSRSLHSIEQLAEAGQYDYVTLSPIFDSISKTGYKSAFKLQDLSRHVEGKRVVALGGVTPDKFADLRNAGFFGAAMLGYFWSSKAALSPRNAGTPTLPHE